MPSPTQQPKRATRSNNKRDKIIAASAVLFEKVGYHRATMQLLADEVGIGKPTLYHYFRSKSQILLAIHEEVITRVIEAHMERIQQDLPTEELLRHIAIDMLTFIKEHPGYVRAFFEHFEELDEDDQKDIRQQRQQFMAAVVGLVQSGIDSGRFRATDPHVAVLGFFGMINWTYKWLPADKTRSVEDVADTLCGLFLDGLRHSA